MARAVLERWPHLQNKHINFDDGMEFWKRRLRTFFKNRRGKNTENLPEIVAKKAIFGKKRPTEDVTTTYQSKKRKLSWGVKNYLPEREAGEDDHTQDSLTTKLKTEWVKPEHRRNEDMINMCMDKTFPDRRKAIVTDIKPVAEILISYPALQARKEVCIKEGSFVILFIYFRSYAVIVLLTKNLLERVNYCRELHYSIFST